MTYEDSKALEQIARTSGAAIDLVQDAGKFVGRVLGTIPEDIAGVIGADWLRHQRIRNLSALHKRTEQILNERGVQDWTAAPPSIALPIMRGAQDESRDDLQDLWAKLLATSLDASSREYIRASFLETARTLDPYDARILKTLWEYAEPKGDRMRKLSHGRIKELTSLGSDSVEISLMALENKNLIIWNSSPAEIRFNAYGREFVRACEGVSNKE